MQIASENQSVHRGIVSGSGTHATVEGVGDSGVVKQLIKTGGNTYKAAIAAEDTEITVSDGDDIANYYQGGTVNFTEYSDSYCLNFM